jgi:hypothetical protein
MTKFYPGWRMTELQHDLYFRLWNTVLKHQGWDKMPTKVREAKRREVHVAVFGAPKSAKDINHTDEFGAIKARFELLAGLVKGGVEDEHPEFDTRRRLFWKFENVQKKQLGVYVNDPEAYIRQILRERFKIFRGISTVEDLDAKPRFRMINGESKKMPSPLLMLVMTLDRCIDDLRAQAGHTIHQMNMEAGVPCRCKECSSAKRLTKEEVAALGESDLAGEAEAVPQDAEEGEPF